MGRYKLGIDIGGTFTDFVLLDEEGGWMEVGKCLTTPEDPSRAVREGFGEILRRTGKKVEEVFITIHGTTLVTNTLIERKGARTGLITTQGFRDVLEMGNEVRYELYDLSLERPEPLVPRHFRRGVSQRMASRGEVLLDLDPAEVREIGRYLREQEVISVAVCLLHSYMNPDHENRINDLLRKEFPDLSISLSSRVNPEIREYERTSTTVANAYVQPLMKKYLRQVEGQLKEKGFRGNLYVMLSSGGITTGKHGGRISRPPLRVRPGSGCSDFQLLCPEHGDQRTDLLRHGWNDGQDLPDPGWQTFSIQRV